MCDVPNWNRYNPARLISVWILDSIDMELYKQNPTEIKIMNFTLLPKSYGLLIG